MTFHEFVRKYNNKYVEFNKDIYKNQCTDLCNQYIKEVLKKTPIRGNGRDWDKNYNPKEFVYLKNTRRFIPKDGDIAVYGILVGIYGHVDIVYVDPKNPATTRTFTAFSQNWPKKSPCHLIKHHMYFGVKGFLRKK